MNNIIAWSMVALTILLTTYGQLVIKWQVMKPVEAPFQALSPKETVLGGNTLVVFALPQE